MEQSLFRKEVLEHQRERLWGEVILAQPLSFRISSMIIGITLVIVVTYLVVATYTRKETVSGYLVPTDGLVRIHSHQPGIITQVLVTPGSQVSEGQDLIRIRTEYALGDGSALNDQVVALLEQQQVQLEDRIERHLQMRTERQAHLESQLAFSRTQLEQLELQFSLQRERTTLSNDRLGSLEQLRKDRLISEEDYLTRYQGLLDERQRLEQTRHAITAEKSRISEARFELESLDATTAETVDQLNSQINDIRQRRLQHRRDQAFTLQAPINGEISSLQAISGQMADPQRPLMTILPEGGELQVELFVPTRAIGFIHEGLDIRVRYDAFPYERFGIHFGEVGAVSKTILAPHEVESPLDLGEPVYRVTAFLSDQWVNAFGQQMPLQAGMTLRADILLDERPLYQWILRPLYSLKGTL